MVADLRTELGEGLLDGRYRLGEPLGAGATGIVFDARRLEDGLPCAIKLLRPELAQRTDLARRLLDEAQACRVIRHPGIAACLDSGTLADGSPYAVFERLEGESLLHLIRRRGPLGLAEALAIGRRIARVLAAIHAAGYTHRDLKPEHIWLSAEAGTLLVYVIDFGVCLPPDAELAQSGRENLLGTPGYLAPEQITGADRVSARADLYGLGATLFEALTGRAPFSGGSPAALLQQTLTADPPSLSRLRGDLPRALDRLLASLLARDPSARPLNARSVERALSALADTPLTTAEHGLVEALQPGSDLLLAATLDESRKTREWAVSAGF